MSLITATLVFPAITLAGKQQQLLGKDLDQNRDQLSSAMHGRNYVVELDHQGKIKQIVDAGANGDGTDAPQTERKDTAVAVTTESQNPIVELPENYQGQAAINRAGVDLPKIAESYGLTPDKLQEILLTDATARLDSQNRLFFVEETIEQQAAIDANPEATTTTGSTDNPPVPIASTAALANTFKLHSKPGASKTLYLDFDGHTAAGTYWSSSIITAPAYDLDGNPAAFNNSELSNIISMWHRVSEDYIAFDVDVTTEAPSTDALVRTSSADKTYGTRVVITKSGTISCSCGGLAYVGVVSLVNSAAYHPAWVFHNALANNEKYIAEAISHEAGHTFGLLHDGQTTPTSTIGYYAGHGANTTSWAPIMGVSYYKNVTQWSSGAYPGANNQQDDLAVFASNGISPRTDAVGNHFYNASLLTNVVSGVSVNAQVFGVIETPSDVDMYAVNTAGGVVTLAVNPAATGANLDTQLTLYKADGTVLASSAPESTLSASISMNVPAGTHFLAVSNSGRALSGTDYGYPSYGSLGQYRVTATFATGGISIPPAPTPPPPVAPAQPKVFAGSLTMKVKKAKKVNAQVAIQVINEQGSPVPNAVVQGAWSGAFAGNLYKTTSASGVVLDNPKATRSKKRGSGTFTIQSISAPGYSYTPANNAKSVATFTW